MTDARRKELCDLGWESYWEGKTQNDCPDYPNQEERDEWMSGWLSAESSDERMDCGPSSYENS